MKRKLKDNIREINGKPKKNHTKNREPQEIIRESKRKTKGVHQEDQRNAKGNSKRNRRKIKGKAIGTPKDNRRRPVEFQRKVRRNTMLKQNENIGKSKESERTPRAAGSSQKHPQAISSKKQPGTARTGQEQPEAARSS